MNQIQEHKDSIKYGKIVKVTGSSSSAGDGPTLILECPYCQNKEACLMNEFTLDLNEDKVNKEGELVHFFIGKNWRCINCEGEYSVLVKSVLQALLDADLVKLTNTFNQKAG